MKKVFVFIAGLLLCGSLFAQGIKFEHGTFNEALAKAKAENKMVFMDCYTTWCGPCKALAKKVFPQKEVGDYFNAHFVSIKVDMEKGEGVQLQKRYAVSSYPTLLFMDATGKVLHKMIGGSNAAGLIAEAKVARDPSQRIGALEKQYVNGDRDVKFVAKYIRALGKAYKKDKMKIVGEEFLSTTPCEQLINVYAFTIIGYSSALKYGSEAYKFIISNKAKFIAAENIGQANYDGVISACISNHLKTIAKKETLAELNAAIEACKKDFISPGQLDMEKALMSDFYLANKQLDKWFATNKKNADDVLATDKNKAYSMYIGTAYNISLNPIFKDSGIYAKAIAMTEKVVADDDRFLAAYYCLAALYKANGNKENALKNINTFIDMSAARGGKSDPRAVNLKKEIERM